MIHTSSFPISISSLSESDELLSHPPSETKIAKVLSSVSVSTWMASPPRDSSAVGRLRLADAFASQGRIKRRHDDPYSLSFSVAMTSASHVPAEAQMGRERWPCPPDKKMSRCEIVMKFNASPSYTSDVIEIG